MVGRIKVTLSKSKEESLTKSHRRFKKVSEPDKGKFSRLPTWLDNVSYRYEKEFTINIIITKEVPLLGLILA